VAAVRIYQAPAEYFIPVDFSHMENRTNWEFHRAVSVSAKASWANFLWERSHYTTELDNWAMIFVSAAPLLSATKSGMVGTAKLT
jgi:hypothetical protein